MSNGGPATEQAPQSGGVFISHIQEDRAIANAFALLVRDVTAGTVPTYSSSSTAAEEGIKYGDEWFQWIRNKVESADHIVALLTPRSVGKPWILFEAGLGKAQPTASMFGVAVGMSVADASVGPFAVFQNSSAEKQSLIKLCNQLLTPANLKPRPEVVAMMVDQFLASVESVVPDHESVVEDPKSAALFQAIEDLKFLIREQRSATTERTSITRSERTWEHIVLKALEEDVLPSRTRRRLLAKAAEYLISPPIGLLAEEALLSTDRAIRTRMAQLALLDRALTETRVSAGNDWVFYFLRREMTQMEHEAIEREERRDLDRERVREAVSERDRREEREARKVEVDADLDVGSDD